MREAKGLDAPADTLGDSSRVFVPATAEHHLKFLTAVTCDDIYVACNFVIRCGLVVLCSKLLCVYIERAESREDVTDGV
jgi:hypothetical protein